MNQRSQHWSHYSLEGLEPRLLLSAEPIVGTAFISGLEIDEPLDAIVVPASENAGVNVQENDHVEDIYNGIGDEPLPVVLGSNEVNPEGDDQPSGESAATTTFHETKTGLDLDAPLPIEGVDNVSPWAEQLVTTLHAGNSPPRSEISQDRPVNAIYKANSDNFTTHLNDAVVQDILTQAVANWLPAISSAQLTERLSQISVDIADLQDGVLGQVQGLHITLDTNAAGHGWFVDPTPSDHSEFIPLPDGSLLAIDSVASRGVDLLTVVMHEMGHVLGLEDQSTLSGGQVMGSRLEVGMRILPHGTTISDSAPINYSIQNLEVSTDASDGLAGGAGALADRIYLFLNGEALLGDQVPILIQAGTDGLGNPVYQSPTVGDLLTVPVDANGDGVIGTGNSPIQLALNPSWDDDEVDLDNLDGNDDNEVDATEFLQGFLFGPLIDYLNTHPATSEDILEFMEGSGIFDFGLDRYLDDLYPSSYLVEFNIINAETDDTTENPDSEVTFVLSFELTVTQMMPIDLGLEADALRIMPFTGSFDSAGIPEVPVTAKMAFALEFGIFTGGATPDDVVNQEDFFIRWAEPLEISVNTNVSPLNFHMNIGFLGAEVVNGSLLLEADVETELLDPDDPILLGFEDSQFGGEQSSGSVTGDLPVASPDLVHDVGFFLRLGNLGESTPLLITAGDYGTMPDLEDAINLELLNVGLGDLVEATIDGSNYLTFSIKPSLTANPLGFGSETISTGDTITGNGTLNYASNVTFLVSENGEVPSLVSLRFPDPSETGIGFTNGQTASLVDPLIATNLADADGDIAGDAEFTLRVRYDDGTLAQSLISISDASTDDNSNIGDLVVDLDNALDAAGFTNVIPSHNSGRLWLTGVADVAGIKILSPNALGESGLGFTGGQAVTVELTGTAVGNTGFDDGDPFTDDTAVFHLSTNNGAFSSFTISDDPGRDLTGLVADINTAISGTGVEAVEDSGKVQLMATSDVVWAIEVRVENQDIGDLVDDLQRALDQSGATGITASESGGNIQLIGEDPGDVLEISGTLTFDAGITYAELTGTAIEDLFDASEGSASTVELLLPVEVIPGLEDAQTGADDDFLPADVRIVGNFDPFDSPAATYDPVENRFRLNFTYDPFDGVPTSPAQDTPAGSVPGPGALSDEVRLVNFGELLNFGILTPESMIGLLNGLGTALQQLTDTATFTEYDIPFADATLSDLLNFADSDKARFSGLIDMLLFDTGGDGVDGDNADANGLLKKVTVDDASALLPAFSTAQTLASRLDALLVEFVAEGPGQINATYDWVTNELTYELHLWASDRTAISIEVPFEHNVPLDPFLKLTTDSSEPPENTSVTVSGRTGLDMVFGVDLSPPGFVIFPGTLLKELNAGTGVDILHVNAVTFPRIFPVSSIEAGEDREPETHFTTNIDFSVSLNGGPGQLVTIVGPQENFSMGDLVADVDNALAAAGLDGDLYADHDGNNLVIAAKDPLTNFTVTVSDINSKIELGFPVIGLAQLVAEKVDFVVYTRDGVEHSVSLDSLDGNSTVQDLIDYLNTIAPASFEAGFNGLQTGIRLTDLTGGGSDFLVDTKNGSEALLGIGLFLNDEGLVPDAASIQGDPDVIQGGGIGLTSLDGRFFIRDAQMRIDGLKLETANPGTGVPGQGLYGIVGVDLNVDGGLIGNVIAEITDPGEEPGEPVDQITLRELAAKTGTLANATVLEVIELDYVDASGSFTVGDLLVTPDVGDSAVIVGADSGKLLLANYRGTISDGDLIGTLAHPVIAEADGLPTFADNFGSFDMPVTIQPGFDDIGFDNDFNALDGVTYNLEFDLTGFGNPYGPADPATNLDVTGNIGELEPLDQFGYDHIRSTLEGLLDVVVDVNSNFTELNTTLPAINRSVAQLLDLVGTFERGVDNIDPVLEAAVFALSPEGLGLPALRLQDLPRALRGAFGLPDGVDPDGSGAVDWVKLDYDTGADELLVSMNLHEEVSTKLGLDIETGGGSPNLTSAGVLEVFGSLDINLNVAIDLASPDSIYLLDTSNFAGYLHVQGEGQEYAGGNDGLGLVFRSSVGPLSVFIKDGDVLIDFEFALPGLDFGGPDRKLLADVTYGDWQSPVITSNVIDIVLPMFYGGEGPNDFIGEFAASGTIAGVSTSEPDYSIIVADITGEVVPYDPFENILLAIDTLDLYLELLSDHIAGEVLGIELPMVSDQLADILFIEDFRRTLVRTLKNGIENSINPDPDSIIQDLIVAAFSGPLSAYLIGGPVQMNSLGPSVLPENRYREWTFEVGHTDYITINNFDIGPDHLTFDVDAPMTVTLVWSIKITFGVDFGNGAYIDVSEPTDIDLDMSITLPGDMNFSPYTGEIGFLRLDVTDPFSDSGATLLFDIDVKDGVTTDPRLGFAEIGSLNPVASLSGTSSMSFLLKTQVNAYTIGLPGLSANLIFNWDLPSTNVDSLNGDAVTPGIQLIALTNMELDAFSAVKQLLGEPFKKIAEIIDPFMPIIDVLTAPIPILSDLAGEPFTILDLADFFGVADTAFISAVADILDVINTIASISYLPPLPLGNFILYDFNEASNYFDIEDPSATLGMEALIDGVTPGLSVDSAGFNDALDDYDFLVQLANGTLVDNLTMPIFTDPIEGINLLVNRDAELVEYELPSLTVGFEYLQVFPVWGPLAVSIEITFNFTLDLHAVGFDTFGYRRFAEGGFWNPGLIFDGFYLADGETDTSDDPEVVFEFGLVGAAEINLGIARAGVGGGINAIITFDWHDSIPDGNVHASEIVGNIIVEGLNPLAPFDVGGALTFELFAFLEIELLGIDLEFPITPETTLFSFEDTAERNPKLGTVSNHTLFLNMGPNAEDRLNGDTSDGHEEFYLRRDGNDVKVWSPALGVGSGDAQTYQDVTYIVGLGGLGDDKIYLENFDGSTSITGYFDGGVGDDVVEFTDTTASTSADGFTIIGGPGNDVLKGSHLNDIIYGNEGNDTVWGNGGYDVLFGDDGRYADTFISSRIRESDGADTMDGGEGDDVVIGAGESDHLNGGAGIDLILGDGGRFDYTMTGGHIDVASLLPTPYVPTPVTTPVDPDIISSEIDELEDFVLDAIRAANLGLGGDDVIEGDGDNDLILGGTGDDEIYGGGGDDVILGGKGFDLIEGGDDDDAIFGGEQADVLSGNDGDDVMAGGPGNDFMHGNADDDVMKGDTGADVMFGDAGDDQLFGQTEPDLLYGGIDNDLVVGGSSNDIMFGDDGIVAKLDPSDGSGLKVIGIGFGGTVPGGQFYDTDKRTLDLIITDVVDGDGNDILSGDAGDDIMLGGGGNDLMGGDVDPRLPNAGTPTEISEDVMIGDGGKITFNERRFRSIETIIGDVDIDDNVDGHPFNDVIYGDNGQDYIFGGRGSDFLFGGHGTIINDVNSEDPEVFLGVFRGATDSGAPDNDIIVGDNGKMFFADDTIPDNYGRLERVMTTDEADITGGHEYVEGEIGNDVIFGGVNGSVDVLYGNVGDDIILGDNGELNFAHDGDTDLNTLDLVRSYRDKLGGIDEISGNAGNDILIGGTAGDEMYGDDAVASSAEQDGEDIMLGDNGDVFLINDPTYDPYTDDITDFGRLYIQVAASEYPTTVDLITTTDALDLGDPLFDTIAKVEAYGGPDTMSGNAQADIMLGGVNNGGTDTMYGDIASPDAFTIADDGDDILLGDNGLLDFTYGTDTDRKTLDFIHSSDLGLGGTDIISGNKGLDVGIGSTGDDIIYGDDELASAGSADLADILIGDNADIFLVAVGGASGGDLKVVLDAAVKTIVTTDNNYSVPDSGGLDIISGNANGDIIAGGVEGDVLYGDRASPTPTTSADDGDDLILGDNGSWEWLSTGRLSEITGIDIEENNLDLFTKYDPAVADTDLTTLDLVTTEQPTNGGRDTIFGDEGNDTIFGGTDLDLIWGDDGDNVGTTTNRDVLFGDHGRIYPQFDRFQLPNSTTLVPTIDLLITYRFPSRNFFAIDIEEADAGAGDVMHGEEGDDLMVGQQGDDRMWGGSEDDDMIGGHNVAGGLDELTAPTIEITLNPPMNDIMDGGSGDDAMAGDNAIIWRRGDDITPRFRELEDGIETIYTTSPDTITTNLDVLYQSNPDDAVGRDIQLVDHHDTTSTGLYGADVMAGGADEDVMYGQLGDDLMQGDGSIELTDVGDPWISRTLDVTDPSVFKNTATPAYTPLYFNIPEAISDGNDYMEGNGGNDLMYGGLGQDDMIGGSSELFGLNDYYAAKLMMIGEQLRPDGSDIIFGGAGVDIAYNDIGDAQQDVTTQVITTDPAGFARDADFIMGDNANVFRLVDAAQDIFLVYVYDDYANRGFERIIPRAMEQLDYTLGGGDYNELGYTSDGSANYELVVNEVVTPLVDNGLGDIIHGESGDDYIFGMTGSDVIYGDGQDDDIVGGYGNDWISGGTGQDGILGDDGLVLTSRNNDGLGEPLYGIAPLLSNDSSTRYSNGDALDETIYTPGNIQIAIINVEGQLKKTVDLVPFSFDPNWIGNDDEIPDNDENDPYADDIIFGGLGSDFLHGASGDDAISGAEALPDARVPAFDSDGNPLAIEPINLGYDAFELPDPVNPGDVVSLDVLKPGDVLAFNPEDVDGQHLNNRYRAGEFHLYDEYDPRRMILLGPEGELFKDAQAIEDQTATEGVDYFHFLLNFDESENSGGVLRLGGIIEGSTGQQADSYDDAWDDGKDAIFGDLGNDWLVGGTGRDNIYGGWGNDLLNADDKHDINDDSSKQNTVSDTHPYYEDRAYGGAGRDVLIGNTGGDRLIDWVGEYNSYLVPFAPFGQATVSRTLQPFLPEFLYALSAGDGADPTRFDDAVQGPQPSPTRNNPIPSRFGEPHGELGLVLQKDFAWQQQTGAPADPQAGNIPGGHRDVLRTAGFNDGEPIGFFVDSGLWTVSEGAYLVEPESKGGDALSVFHVDKYVPSYFEIMGTLNPQKPTGGFKSNAYLIFDYHSALDFKFAGINVSTNKLEIGHRDETGWVVDTQGVFTKSLKSNTNYNVFLAVNGTVVTLVVDANVSLTHTFDPRVDSDGFLIGFNQGMVGLGANNSIASIDNVIVQRLAPEITYSETTDFITNASSLLINPNASGWNLDMGTYTGLSTGDPVVSLLRFGVAPAAVARLITTLSTTSEGGFVFDYYAPDDFKFVTYSADTGVLSIGHRTSHGWTIDATYETGEQGTLSQDLEVTLKGTTVSIMLNDQVVLGHAFNALITDGTQGLLGVSGETHFDTLTYQTDDLAYILEPVSQTLESGAKTSSILLVPVYDTFDFYRESDSQFSTLSSPELTDFSDLQLVVSDEDLYYLY